MSEAWAYNMNNNGKSIRYTRKIFQKAKYFGENNVFMLLQAIYHMCYSATMLFRIWGENLVESITFFILFTNNSAATMIKLICITRKSSKHPSVALGNCISKYYVFTESVNNSPGSLSIKYFCSSISKQQFEF